MPAASIHENGFKNQAELKQLKPFLKFAEAFLLILRYQALMYAHIWCIFIKK